MFAFLPPTLRGILSALMLLGNTIGCFIPLVMVSILKVVIPWKPSRMLCTKILILLGTGWIGVNNKMMALFSRIDWDVRGMEGIEPNGWYLVVSNHQSWVDILVLQNIFNRKIPFLKFFLKQELIWVPLMGVAWWALDFPFMKRYSKEYLAKHPQHKGKDLAATKAACAKFRSTPVSVMNFVEGTRFSAAKQKRQNSPFSHLLRPKAGGIAYVLSAMGDHLQSIVDVTICYPEGPQSFWGLLCGRVRTIRIDIRLRPITDEILGDYFEDSDFRETFCLWLNEIWEQKDLRLTQMKKNVWEKEEKSRQDDAAA